MQINVLESEDVPFEGELLVVPTKVEVDGRVCDVERENFPVGDIRDLSIEELKGLKLGDIPNNLTLNCESTDVGWLKLQRRYVSVEVMNRAKYWRGNISIENYFELLKCLFSKKGFELINDFGDNDYYIVEFGKEFSEETKIEEAYETFKQPFNKMSSFEKIVNLIVNALVSLRRMW